MTKHINALNAIDITIMNLKIARLCQILFLSTLIWLYFSILKISNSCLETKPILNRKNFTEFYHLHSTYIL